MAAELVYEKVTDCRKLHGRRTIYIEDKVYGRENIITAVGKIEAVHRINAGEEVYLKEYVKGWQPVYDRIKQIRPEIKNTPVENHALEILNFKTGFMFGEPVQYVLHGDCKLHERKEGDEDTRVASLNEFMGLDDKPSNDKQLGTELFTTGVGYRMVFPSPKGSDKPFDTYIPKAERTWVAVSDDYREEPVLCGYYDRHMRRLTVYSREKRFVIENGRVIRESVNNMGYLPVIMYTANPQMMGCFEVVLDLCNSLNDLQANRLDGVEQFVQSFVWFHNTEVDAKGFEQLKAQGGIVTRSPNGAAQANIKILSEAVDQQQVQTLADDIYQKMLTIAAVPDRRASAGGNTGQALIIGEGWVMAESAAKDFELEFIKPEKRFLRTVLKILRNTADIPAEIGTLALSDIDIKFMRNKTDNLLVKTQALTNMLKAGVHPRTAFKLSGLFNDPEQAYQDSIPYLDAMRTGDMSYIMKKADNNDPVGEELLEFMSKLRKDIEADEQEES
ncbi:MAG: phage portal protein [Ruminococcus sp.]|nr:phage portal protein [Ruminococcus sp.]